MCFLRYACLGKLFPLSIPGKGHSQTPYSLNVHEYPTPTSLGYMSVVLDGLALDCDDIRPHTSTPNNGIIAL